MTVDYPPMFGRSTLVVVWAGNLVACGQLSGESYAPLEA
jgi:hypothetical protein